MKRPKEKNRIMRRFSALMLGMAFVAVSSFAAQAPATDTPATPPAKKHVKRHKKAAKPAPATPATPTTPTK